MDNLDYAMLEYLFKNGETAGTELIKRFSRKYRTVPERINVLRLHEENERGQLIYGTAYIEEVGLTADRWGNPV